jgi:acyl dehydratase
MPPQVISVQEVSRLEGQEVGITTWHRVTQEEVDAFAHATHDTYWIHTDPERARKESPFGTTVAHGFFTLSLTAYFLQQVLAVEGAKIAINYGVNRVRFPAPCPVGSQIRARVTLTKVEEVPGGIQCTVSFTIERDGELKPVCVAEKIIRYYL